MKKVNLTDISDPAQLSWILDQSVFLLSRSAAQLRLSDLARVLGLQNPVLTRIRLLHANPQYEPLVNRQVLFHTLKFVLNQFPTLVLRQNADGKILVHLYKKHAGQKLLPLPADLPVIPVVKRHPPKPGSTRWFLEQLSQEQAHEMESGLAESA